MKLKPYRWWHGVAFYVAVNVAARVLRVAAGAAAGRERPASRKQDRSLYRAERLPRFAPPPAAFPIAWTINSIAAIAGGIHVLNLPPGSPGRERFLRLQAVAWGLYCSFEAAYFGLRSPINAAGITLLYSAATLASVNVALQRMQDKTAALSLAPTVAWLALANPLGITQAAWNRDPFWKTGPLLEPPAGWTKSGRERAA